VSRKQTVTIAVLFVVAVAAIAVGTMTEIALIFGVAIVALAAAAIVSFRARGNSDVDEYEYEMEEMENADEALIGTGFAKSESPDDMFSQTTFVHRGPKGTTTTSSKPVTNGPPANTESEFTEDFDIS
jgi:uncharacterized protein (DUF58 family)